MQGFRIVNLIMQSAYLIGHALFIVMLYRKRQPTPVWRWFFLAAIAMFYGVGNWNGYMDCLLYTNTQKLQVLQLYLRVIMEQTAMNSLSSADAAAVNAASAELTDETVKMTTVAVSVIPILVVYPFLQRFYTKGITVGAVKG